jgi:hypothetical protein
MQVRHEGAGPVKYFVADGFGGFRLVLSLEMAVRGWRAAAEINPWPTTCVESAGEGA